MAVETVTDLLDRAIKLGKRIQAIRARAELWSLSQAAWDRRAHALAPDMPADAWSRLAPYPSLRSAIETRAQLWVDGRQDRPALYPFGGERDLATHVERLASGLTIEDCSRMASVRCAELRSPKSWGAADSVDPCDGDLALAPHRRELADLDQQISGVLLARQLTYRDGRAFLEHAWIAIELSQGTVLAIASSFAEVAALRVDRVESEAAAA